MIDYREEYCRKRISAEDAVSLIQPGDWFEYGFGAGFPPTIDEEIAARSDELKDTKLRMGWSLYSSKLVEKAPSQENVILNTFFVSPSMRKPVREGIVSPLPRSFGDSGKVYREALADRVDVVFVTVTPMDRYGYFNFGAACSQNRALCEVAKKVVVEINEAQPWACGGFDEAIHISEVDYIVEGKHNSLPELKPIAPNPQQEQIADIIGNFLEDGITLQLGIGALPNMVCEQIKQKKLKNLGVHSELFTEGMMELMEMGIINGREKTLNKGKVAYTFANGSKQLFEYIDHNCALAAFPVEYINNPFIIAQNAKMISVNSALRIDLTGQVNAESVGPYQISGSGGQLDFHRGAYNAPGGKAFLCIPAVFTDKQGKKVSNIVPTLAIGDSITDPRNDVSYVVTEFGVVNLKGRSMWERARLLISIAHPDFREELTAKAIELGYLTLGTAKASLR